MTVDCILNEDDIHGFNVGTPFRLYQKLGAHPLAAEGQAGIYFAVWVPNAEAVAAHGRPYSLNRTLPSPGILLLQGPHLGEH